MPNVEKIVLNNETLTIKDMAAHNLIATNTASISAMKTDINNIKTGYDGLSYRVSEDTRRLDAIDELDLSNKLASIDNTTSQLWDQVNSVGAQVTELTPVVTESAKYVHGKTGTLAASSAWTLNYRLPQGSVYFVIIGIVYEGMTLNYCAMVSAMGGRAETTMFKDFDIEGLFTVTYSTTGVTLTSKQTKNYYASIKIMG